MGKLITFLGVVLSQLMIGFLLNNNQAPIGSSAISTCSPADLFEQRVRNVPIRFSRRSWGQSRSQSFVPLDQRSENVSSGGNHYERTKEITEFWLSGSLRICIYGACLKWLLPELSFSDRWLRGTKLWERDCRGGGRLRDEPKECLRRRLRATLTSSKWRLKSLYSTRL